MNVFDYIEKELDRIEVGYTSYDGTKITLTMDEVRELVKNLRKKYKADGNVVYRQDAINVANRADYRGLLVEDVKKVTDEVVKGLKQLPSAQPEITEEQAIEHLQSTGWMQNHDREMYDMGLKKQLADDSGSYDSLLPSAQPERTCVNCGRTVNNGGWYADGGTRCPIEEHYALPKDGYCHLWEKRNVTDDDYPERREE